MPPAIQYLNIGNCIIFLRIHFFLAFYYNKIIIFIFFSLLKTGEIEFAFFRRDSRKLDFTLLSPKIELNKWTFVAASYHYDTGSVKIYLDGVEAASATYGPTLLSSNKAISMGGNGRKRNFIGRISCMELYRTVLTSTEIAAKQGCKFGE